MRFVGVSAKANTNSFFMSKIQQMRDLDNMQGFTEYSDNF